MAETVNIRFLITSRIIHSILNIKIADRFPVVGVWVPAHKCLLVKGRSTVAVVVEDRAEQSKLESSLECCWCHM